MSEKLRLAAPYSAFVVNRYAGGRRRGRTLQADGATNWWLGMWNGNAGHYADTGFVARKKANDDEWCATRPLRDATAGARALPRARVRFPRPSPFR